MLTYLNHNSANVNQGSAFIYPDVCAITRPFLVPIQLEFSLPIITTTYVFPVSLKTMSLGVGAMTQWLRAMADLLGGFQYPHGEPQPSVASIPGDQCSTLVSVGTASTWYTYMQAKLPYAGNKNKYIFCACAHILFGT